MQNSVKKEGQQAFSFEVQPIEIVTEHPAVVKEAPKAQLDAQGHRWWASVARGAQEHCIAQSCQGKDEVEVMAWAALAKHWKALATHHEAKGHLLEGERG